VELDKVTSGFGKTEKKIFEKGSKLLTIRGQLKVNFD
jgi:hypothetical protein